MTEEDPEIKEFMACIGMAIFILVAVLLFLIVLVKYTTVTVIIILILLLSGWLHSEQCGEDIIRDCGSIKRVLKETSNRVRQWIN